MTGLKAVFTRWFATASTETPRRVRRGRRTHRHGRHRRSSALQMFSKLTLGFFLVGCAGERPFARSKPNQTAIDSIVESEKSGDRPRIFRELASKADSRDPKEQELARLYLMRAATKDSSALARATAVASLARFNDVAALEAVIAASSDPNPLVRMQSAKTMGKLCTAPAQGGKTAPTELLLRNPDRGSQAIERLCVMAEKDNAHDVRLAATESLGLFQDKRAHLTLVKCLQDNQITIVHAAASSLKKNTGADYGSNSEAWLAHLEKSDGTIQPANFKAQNPPPGNNNPNTDVRFAR